MKWDKSYIIVRPIQNYLLSVLHTAETLKDARYWLQHVANPGDAIFITPVHGQYKGSGNPGYMCHVQTKGRAEFNESQWERSVFPECEKKEYSFLKESLSGKIKKDSTAEITETQVLELLKSSSNPVKLGLDQLQSILKMNSRQIDVILSDPSKWINWESAMTLMLKDVYVISVNPDSEWPLTVTMKSDERAGEQMDYNSDMKFIIRPRT
jgi:hypothetical protein